jgi:hypothetical protein
MALSYLDCKFGEEVVEQIKLRLEKIIKDDFTY